MKKISDALSSFKKYDEKVKEKVMLKSKYDTWIGILSSNGSDKNANKLIDMIGKYRLLDDTNAGQKDEMEK